MSIHTYVHNNKPRARLRGLLLLLPLFSLPAWAADDDSAKLQQQITMFETLLNKSNSAKKVEQNGDGQAHALHDQAQAKLDQAKAALAQGDLTGAQDALAQAKQMVFGAMRRSGEPDIKAKKQADYQRKLEGTTSLREAYTRVAKEKGVDTHEVDTYVSQELSKAQTQYDKGDYDNALQGVDNAFLSLKLSLTQLRSGDTLVRSLDFATKKDEYDYELDRNNTHFMLIDMLLQEKLSDTRFKSMVERPLAQAKTLRSSAEAQAQQGEHAQAIDTLEQSTRQLIQVIRAAGIYIPG